MGGPHGRAFRASWVSATGRREHEGAMLEKTRSAATAVSKDETPLVIRRIDAIPVALPLKAPMKMANATVTKAENLLVRVEAADGTIGWGEAASAPTMTGDTLGGLLAAVLDYLAPMLVGKNAHEWPSLRPTLHDALLGNGGAHS